MGKNFKSSQETSPRKTNQTVSMKMQHLTLPMSPETSKRTILNWSSQKRENPPFGPDLSLCGFHEFCQIKEALAKERFGNDERMKNAVRKRLTDVGVDFFQQWQ